MLSGLTRGTVHIPDVPSLLGVPSHKILPTYPQSNGKAVKYMKRIIQGTWAAGPTQVSTGTLAVSVKMGWDIFSTETVW